MNFVQYLKMYAQHINTVSRSSLATKWDKKIIQFCLAAHKYNITAINTWIAEEHKKWEQEWAP